MSNVVPDTLDAELPQSRFASEGKMIRMSFSVGSLEAILNQTCGFHCPDPSPSSDGLFVIPYLRPGTGHQPK